MGRHRRTPIEIAIDQATTGPDRQSRHMAKRREEGLVRIAVWVPQKSAEEFKLACKAAVAAHQASSSDD